jgi:hypothetical protein
MTTSWPLPDLSSRVECPPPGFGAAPTLSRDPHPLRGEQPVVFDWDRDLNRLRSRSALMLEINRWARNPPTIPAAVHQSWKMCGNLNHRQRAWHHHTAKVLPQNWSMWLWRDADNRALIARDFPSFLDLYDGYDTHIKRIDAVRYFYLFRYGGVYMDLDMMSVQPFERLPLLPGFASFGLTGRYRGGSAEECLLGKCIQHDSEEIHPALMIAPPRHPLFAFLIHRLRKFANRTFHGKKGHPLAATGPLFLANGLRAWAIDDAQGYLHVHQSPTFFSGGPPQNPLRQEHRCGWSVSNPSTQKRYKRMPACKQILGERALTTSFWSTTWLAQWVNETQQLQYFVGSDPHLAESQTQHPLTGTRRLAGPSR